MQIYAWNAPTYVWQPPSGPAWGAYALPRPPRRQWGGLLLRGGWKGNGSASKGNGRGKGGKRGRKWGEGHAAKVTLSRMNLRSWAAIVLYLRRCRRRGKGIARRCRDQPHSRDTTVRTQLSCPSDHAHLSNCQPVQSHHQHHRHCAAVTSPRTPSILFRSTCCKLEIHSWARYTVQSKAELKWQ